ncbi:uncharacterized protein BDV17DRAFT_295623 [Aspergillus undulatus]|uniref:uncharacterized protein n=1 Tax=Aspergillus undulatus TaxID=1810928 RepID=UPI003CCD346C
MSEGNRCFLLPMQLNAGRAFTILQSKVGGAAVCPILSFGKRGMYSNAFKNLQKRQRKKGTKAFAQDQQVQPTTAAQAVVKQDAQGMDAQGDARHSTTSGRETLAVGNIICWDEVVIDPRIIPIYGISGHALYALKPVSQHLTLTLPVYEIYVSITSFLTYRGLVPSSNTALNIAVSTSHLQWLHSW